MAVVAVMIIMIIIVIHLIRTTSLHSAMHRIQRMAQKITPSPIFFANAPKKEKEEKGFLVLQV